MDGPTIAVSASAPLGDRLGMFGSLGGGRLKSDVLPLTTGLKTTYTSLELGLSYSVDWFGKASALTASYRQQRYKQRNYPIAGGGVVNFTDTTHGPVIGFVTTF
jgi:hypothetical protein